MGAKVQLNRDQILIGIMAKLEAYYGIYADVVEYTGRPELQILRQCVDSTIEILRRAVPAEAFQEQEKYNELIDSWFDRIESAARNLFLSGHERVLAGDAEFSEKMAMHQFEAAQFFGKVRRNLSIYKGGVSGHSVRMGPKGELAISPISSWAYASKPHTVEMHIITGDDVPQRNKAANEAISLKR